MKQVIKVRYFDNVPKLKQIPEGDCIDLTVAKIIEDKEDYIFVDFGIAMELPKGCVAKIYPRSSTFKKYGLVLSNSVGYIDQTYIGDNDRWKGCFIKTDHNAEPIKVGDRIAQFEIVPSMKASIRQKLRYLFTSSFNFREVSLLGNKSRNGFGSTGR